MTKFKKKNYRVPVFNWCPKIEKNTMEQVDNLASLPFAFHHIALMPDAHTGYGMPIGGVLATKEVVIPNAVGVDIGCGMCAVKTSLTDIDTETLKKIMGKIRKVIPVGFKKHSKEQDEHLMPDKNIINKRINARLKDNDYPVVCEQYNNALKSLGTLGGGNHFLEIQKGDDGHIWIMVHSGSRNLGKQVADHYNKIAIKLNAKHPVYVPKKWQLAFLPLDSKEGRAYIREMNYCVDFAFANRKLMINRVIGIFNSFQKTLGFNKILYGKMINIAHNYARIEKHFGGNVMVHRKGATLADKNTTGIIPGSQGSVSYIVKGLGNKDSFNSCSHGAGRKIGRKEAQRTLDLKTEIEKLNKKNIIHSIRNVKDLDEAPSAYKNIQRIMENQKDLVKIITELSPLAVIKG